MKTSAIISLLTATSLAAAIPLPSDQAPKDLLNEASAATGLPKNIALDNKDQLPTPLGAIKGAKRDVPVVGDLLAGTGLAKRIPIAGDLLPETGGLPVVKRDSDNHNLPVNPADALKDVPVPVPGSELGSLKDKLPIGTEGVPVVDSVAHIKKGLPAESLPFVPSFDAVMGLASDVDDLAAGQAL